MIEHVSRASEKTSQVLDMMTREFIRVHWMEIEGKWTPEPIVTEQRFGDVITYWIDKNKKKHLKPEAIKVYLDSDVTPWPVLSPISIDRAMLVVSFSSERISIDIVERET